VRTSVVEAVLLLPVALFLFVVFALASTENLEREPATRIHGYVEPVEAGLHWELPQPKLEDGFVAP
jgi:hypothetical protein